MKKVFYALLLTILVFGSNAFAQNKSLVFAAAPDGHGTEGEKDEQLIEAITAHGGYDITVLDFFPLDEALDLPILEAADIIIMGRSVNSGDVDHDFWDQITTPVLYTSPWVVRGDRAGMVTVEGADNVVDDESAVFQVDITDLSNPIFEGITSESIDLWIGYHSVLRPETGTINGNILAQTADGSIVLSMYEANVPFIEGGRTPAGARAYMGLGQDNVEPSTYFSYTDDGKTIFFRVLEALIGGDTPTQKISADKAELSVFATISMVSISMIDLNRVEVYSLDGKMMLSGNANSNQIELNASFNNGVYIVKAFDSNGSAAAQKFVVQ